MDESQVVEWLVGNGKLFNSLKNIANVNVYRPPDNRNGKSSFPLMGYMYVRLQCSRCEQITDWVGCLWARESDLSKASVCSTFSCSI